MGNIICNVIANIFGNIFPLFIPAYSDITYNNNNVCTNGKSTCPGSCTVVEKKKDISYLSKQLVHSKKRKSHLHKVYYCSSCKILLDNQNLLKSHCTLHLHKKCSLDDIIQFKFNENEIVINCIFCKTIMHSEMELARHLKLQSHMTMVQHFSYIDKENNLNFPDNSTNQILDSTILESSNSHIENLTVKVFCDLCQIMFEESDINLHTHHEEHCEKIMTCNNKKENIESETLIDHTSPNFFTCFICLNVSFDTCQQFFKHLNETKHKSKVSILKQLVNTTGEINSSLQEIKFYCQLCLVNVNEFVIDHLRFPFVDTMICSYGLSVIMKDIISKQKKNDNTYASKTDIQIMNENFVTYNDIDRYRCNICNCTKTSEKKLCIHILSNRHQNNLLVVKSKNLGEPQHSINLKNTKVQHKAPAVDENVSSKSSNFENFSFLQSYKSSLLINDELNELIDFDLDNINPRSISSKASKQYKRVNLTPSYSLDQIKITNANKFIELCLKPGLTNIYHISYETIQLLQTSINLTVPFNSEKRVCIPCQCKFFNCYLYDHLHCNEHIENLYNMEKVCSREPLTDTNLYQFYIKKYPNNWIFCYACGTYGYVTEDIIINHISSERHIMRSLFCYTNSKITFQEIIAISKNLWYYVHVFTCNICNKRFEVEFDFIAHLESEEHKNNYVKLPNTMMMKFGICPVCVTCWYGEPDFYSKHCLDDFHRRFLTSNEFMVPEMSKLAVELLNEPDLIVNNLLNESNKTIEAGKNKELLKSIEECVKSVYPKAKAYLYGSRLSHQGFLDSDVDIFLDCDNNYYYAGSKKQSEVYLNSALDLFEVEKDNWITVEVLVDTRVPILKLRHIFTNSKCDISFTNGLGVEKSKLVKYYNVSFPICRQLILFLKKWLHYCRLSGSTGINTYALSWLVIFYLQSEKIVPNVSQLIKKSNSSLIVAGWECPILNATKISSTNLALKDVLKGFFLYYGAFNYQFNVVCPLTGEPISKHYFAETKQLPEEMKNYKKKVINDEIEFFQFDSPMCVQDPVDHSQNMTKAVTKLQLRSFRKYCTESAVLLSYKESAGSEE